jgi:hypothetical protein
MLAAGFTEGEIRRMIVDNRQADAFQREFRQVAGMLA